MIIADADQREDCRFRKMHFRKIKINQDLMIILLDFIPG